MKVFAWIEEKAKRSLTRFGAASLWGLALFLLLSYLNLWEKDHIDLLSVLFALGNGALSSVVIKIFLEIKNRKVTPLIYLLPGVIFFDGPSRFPPFRGEKGKVCLSSRISGGSGIIRPVPPDGGGYFSLHRGGECPFISSVLALVD